MLNERSPTKKHLYKMVYNANQSVMTGQVNGCLGWDGGGCVGDALGITKSHRKLLRAIAMFTILILVISRIRISKRINLCFLDM